MHRTLARWTSGLLVLTVAAMVLLAWWPGITAAEGDDDPPGTATEPAEDATPSSQIEPWSSGGVPFGLGLPLRGLFPGGGALACAVTDGDWEEQAQAFLEDVAVRLGVSADDLRNAFAEVAQERVAEHIRRAVEDGRLDQEDADVMLEALAAGTLGEDLRVRAEERIAERVAEALAEGKLTGEQAETILERLDSDTLSEPWRCDARERGDRGGWRHGPMHAPMHGPMHGSLCPFAPFRPFGGTDDDRDQSEQSDSGTADRTSEVGSEA